VLRGDENLSAHGSLHRALAAARLKDGNLVYSNLRKILGNNMVFRSLMTSHNPNLDIYNADAANALPGVLSEAIVYTRPGIVELLPALPDQLAKGSITGVRGRNRVRVDSLGWDLAARTATVTLTSAVTQTITLISRRGMASVATSAPVAPSALGSHARVISLTAGQQVQITVGLLPGYHRLVNRRSGKVLDVFGASTADGAKAIQWTWTGGANQQWRLEPGVDMSYKLVSRHSGKVLEVPGGSTTPGVQLDQWSDTNSAHQRWRLVDTGDGYYRLVNVRTGLVADVSGGSLNDGAQVVQWAATGGTNQQWQLVAL
jgi:hypothetical protein